MALYMTQFAYTTEAWAALARRPEDRETGLRELVQRFGGTLRNLYYSFGEYDGVVIFDVPDDIAAAAVPLAAVAAGHIKAIKTTRLLTVQEAMSAMQKAGAATYRAPAG